MNKDTSEVKNHILSVIRSKGPGLPVQIAREIGSSPLFASAFLSELVAEKKLVLSNMRVGNSPLYMIPGQELQLERFSEHLNSKEREALELLKREKFLKDIEQEPSIRVALRNIRDFAKPFKINDEIYWRHFSADEKEFSKKPEKEAESNIKDEREPGIFDSKKDGEDTKEEKSKPKTVKTKKKSSKKSSSKTKKEKFFNHVKTYLNEQDIKLKDILQMGSNYLVLLINKESDKVLVAFNKKRINETDIAKANKKASEYKLPYILLSKGGPLKRIENLKKDLKSLEEFRKL